MPAARRLSPYFPPEHQLLPVNQFRDAAAVPGRVKAAESPVVLLPRYQTRSCTPDKCLAETRCVTNASCPPVVTVLPTRTPTPTGQSIPGCGCGPWQSQSCGISGCTA